MALVLDDRPVALIFRSPVFNASETFIQAQAAGLRRYQPVVAGLIDKGGALPELQGRLLLPRTLGERLRATWLGDLGPLVDPARRVRPRLVHAQFGPDGLRAMPLARALDVPLLTTLRGYDVHRTDGALLRSGRPSWMRYAMRRHLLARQGTLFLAVSDALRQQAVARGFPADRVLTHYNGVDLALFRPAPGPPPERTILHVGRLVEKKGTIRLIRAFAGLAGDIPDARLLIVGDGPLRPRLEREVAALGLGTRVRFAGKLAQGKVVEHMRSAWVLAAPSLTARDGDAEGLPNVIVEAAACGLPAVASRHAGAPEAVGDGTTGFLVPEGAVEPLADALRSLLASADLQRQFAEAAVGLARQRFDGRRQNETLELIYDSLDDAHRAMSWT